eukprot:6214149-Pleurochrysis_carterae.AAC.3
MGMQLRELIHSQRVPNCLGSGARRQTLSVCTATDQARVCMLKSQKLPAICLKWKAKIPKDATPFVSPQSRPRLLSPLTANVCTPFCAPFILGISFRDARFLQAGHGHL